ncbi:MAG: sigma 54-interacting transcriptional regulator, partial [Crocinitomix sp.]|nr:sigma 54-interacting transcriptional regulator [Crocinitomix sp.]
MKLFSQGGEKRKYAYNQLSYFIFNPGMFSVCVLGKRGVGKKEAIIKVFEERQKETPKDNIAAMSKLVFINCGALEEGEDKIGGIFKDNENHVIVFNEVEKLSEVNQGHLFDALSTVDGKFGIDEKVTARVVFVSSADIEDLRDSSKGILLG